MIDTNKTQAAEGNQAGGRLADRVVVVTGGAVGIGRATCLAIAREKAKVVVSDVDMHGGEETVAAVRKVGGEAVFVKTDVSEEREVEALMDRVVKDFGRIDGAFNNAGIEGDQAPSADCTLENFQRVLDINLRGTWLCMKHEIRRMLDRGQGAIVNNSSVAGLVGFPNLPAYVASKHGVIGLTRTAALEYAQRGIRVNAVCPGVIRTEMIDRITGEDPQTEEEFTALEPVGRMGRPEEVAEAVVWLLSDASSFMTGHPLAIDGGFTAR